MAYNPYSDLKKIYNYKTEYNKAKSANDTAGMQNAQDSAAMFYQNLRDNGYSAYADQMSGYTEDQARDWVNSFGTEQPSVQVNAGVMEQKFTQPVAPAAANNANGSIYQGITPDVYKWVQGITDNKTMYDNSKFTLQDGNFQQYADLAVPLYESLRSSGRNDIADYLSSSNTPQALEYLRSIGIELDPAQQDMNAIVNNLLTQPSQSFNMSDIWQQSQPIIDYISQATKPDAQTQAANQQAMNNKNALFGTIMGNNQQIQQDSAALNELIKQYMGEQSGRYDDLYNWLKTSNPYETDVAKSIMQYYNAQGGKAANGVTAEGIAQNAGNIDSYAAANALRQQLDFTNAGNQAVLNQYNAQSGKMLDTLKALGVDVGDAQDRLMGILGGNQAYNAELAGQYNDGTAEILGLINQNALAGNTAAVDALQSILGLYEAGMANDTNRYLGQLGTAGELLANRESLQAEKDIAYLNAQKEIESKYAQLASDEKISADELAQEKALKEAQLAYDYYNTDSKAFIDKYKADSAYSSDINTANINAAADRYVADKNAEADIEAAKLKGESNASSKGDTGSSGQKGTYDEYTKTLLYDLQTAVKENPLTPIDILIRQSSEDIFELIGRSDMSTTDKNRWIESFINKYTIKDEEGNAVSLNLDTVGPLTQTEMEEQKSTLTEEEAKEREKALKDINNIRFIDINAKKEAESNIALLDPSVQSKMTEATGYYALFVDENNNAYKDFVPVTNEQMKAVAETAKYLSTLPVNIQQAVVNRLSTKDLRDLAKVKFAANNLLTTWKNTSNNPLVDALSNPFVNIPAPNSNGTLPIWTK